jgi:hypothetical protein
MGNDLIGAMRRAIVEIEKRSDRKVRILHHNDSDGLSSGAILSRAFERKSFAVQRVCLEKPYPVVLERIFDTTDDLIVLTDFAGRIAPLISDLNRGRNLVLILDHHKAELPTDPRVHLLDPEIFGLRGDRDITASTTCYLFARTWDTANADLAAIAVIGAVGDRFFVDGKVVGPNRDAVLETASRGETRIEESDEGERYFLVTHSGEVPVDIVARELDTLGGAGYADGGPEMGIRVCLEGRTADSDSMVRRLRTIEDRAFAEELRRIRSGEMETTVHTQWIQVHDRFAPMGVKMIGAFLDAIKNSEVVDGGKYLAGFQVIPREVPGIGAFDFGQVKVSMRVSDRMSEGIRSGDVLGLDILLPQATERVGGFSDACHSLTAATTIPMGSEKELIEQMEMILGAP